MKNNEDVRWEQRLSHYEKALGSLLGDIQLATDRELSDIEKRGVIQAFEYTYELAWNVIKDFQKETGSEDIIGSKDAFQWAFKSKLVSTDILLKTIKSRQLTSHSYNKEVADEIYNNIIELYYDGFKELYDNLNLQKQKRNL